MGLQGTWYNELGSTLEIKEVSKGTLAGSYETAVSEGPVTGQFEVVGRTDVDRGGETVGFAVTWVNDQSNSNSTTTWAGHYLNSGGDEHLTAFWLLVMRTDPGDEWASTLVGEDVFRRKTLSPERQAEVGTLKRHAHPVGA
jgi:hypothetical protein